MYQLYGDQIIEKMTENVAKAHKLYPQKGKNLGMRMASAFSDIFSSGYEEAILIGTDCPDIRANILTEAFDNLDSIKMSNRNEYEINHLINSMDNLKFEELNICWYDLTYEQDKQVIEDIIQNC